MFSLFDIPAYVFTSSVNILQFECEISVRFDILSSKKTCVIFFSMRGTGRPTGRASKYDTSFSQEVKRPKGKHRFGTGFFSLSQITIEEEDRRVKLVAARIRAREAIDS